MYRNKLKPYYLLTANHFASAKGENTGYSWQVYVMYNSVFPHHIRQVPWEVLKTAAVEGHGFQHLPRDLANVNALKNHVRSLLLHKNWKHLLHFALFLHNFVSPLNRSLANVISTDYARSRAGQYTSRNGSKSVAPVQSYWKLSSRALTARELSC